MSTEQSVDPILVEQTKQQIRSLVIEIAQLAKQEMSVQEFYGEFLNRVVSALAAVGGAVWAPGDGGAMELQYQINLRETRLAENQQSIARHGMLIHKAFSSGEGALVAPHSGEGDEGQPANPTDFLLVLGPVKVEKETKGVVEIFQRPGSPPTTQRGYLKFLLQMCDIASDYLKTRQLRHFTDRQALWNQLENFSRQAHTSLDPRDTAFTIANEGRRLIECDRVSVAIRKGRKCTIAAISNQDTFDKRSNTVSLLNRLATAVVVTGEPLWYAGDTTNLAPQVETALQEYVDDSHSKHVAVLPLKRPPEPGEDKDSSETIGALIVEQIEDARPREGMVQRVNVVCDHSSLALANALEHNNLFLLPVWKTLGKASWIVSARTLPKTVAVIATVAAVVAALAIIRVPFTLSSDGTLQPVERRDVFAAVDGTITRVLVKANDIVEEGQVLVEMRNTDLDVATTKVEGDLNTARESSFNVERALLDQRRQMAPDERERLSSEKSELDQQINSLKAQLTIYRLKKEKLKVVSPIAGIITTPDLERLLLTRTVRPGAVLMSVANPEKDWQLELHMPEVRMGHVSRAQLEEPALDVTYHLATESDQRRSGKVKEVHWSAEVRGDEGNTVLIKVAINKEELAGLLRPGASVKANVHCGRSSIGYWLFHDAKDFVETRVLFPLGL